MRLLPARDAHYRRGTIMGLTAAEAFMLICFILLLLIGLWQRQTLDRLKTANAELQKVRVFHDSFTPPQRIAAVAYKDALEDLGADLQKVKSFEQLLAEAGGEAKFRETLQTLREVNQVPPTEVVERVRLLDDRLVRQIADATSQLPTETKRKLVDLTSVEQFQAMIEVAHSSPEAIVEAVDRLKKFEALGRTAEELAATADELEAYKLTGLTPQDVRALSALATEVDGLTEEVAAFRASGLSPEEAKKLASAIDQLRSADAQSGTDIAAEIRRRAGGLITEMGGQILENGSVTFPEGVLFDPGESALKPEFEKVLSRFCQPWLEVLRDFDVSLRNVQIEGHASSEWNDATPPVAFINNLGLSQARAAVVFQRCLDYVEDDALAAWARTRLAAVGYSSSRPVLSETGIEDRERSRRVVFALDVKTADDLLIEDIVSAPPEPTIEALSLGQFIPEGLATLAKSATIPADLEAQGFNEIVGTIETVVDGDTLFVGSEKVRLQGLHAPELSDPSGREATALLERSSLGKQASCWMTGSTTYDRSEGVCFVDGFDLATVIISNGLGRDCPSFSEGRYSELEALVTYTFPLELPDYCTQ